MHGDVECLVSKPLTSSGNHDVIELKELEVIDSLNQGHDDGDLELVAVVFVLDERVDHLGEEKALRICVVAIHKGVAPGVAYVCTVCRVSWCALLGHNLNADSVF